MGGAGDPNVDRDPYKAAANSAANPQGPAFWTTAMTPRRDGVLVAGTATEARRRIAGEEKYKTWEDVMNKGFPTSAEVLPLFFFSFLSSPLKHIGVYENSKDETGDYGRAKRV